MLFLSVLAIAGYITAVSAQAKGFNYGATNTDGSIKTQEQFQAEFTAAQGITGAPGFTSARLYTSIQGGTTNTPSGAFLAAIETKTSLLLGIWTSAGETIVNNEVAAIQAAVAQYGTEFTDLVVGISVGSEDLYRITPLGVASNAGPGVEPGPLANYINQVRSALSGTTLAGKPVGHVDTWQQWIDSANKAVLDASDFIGFDAYPYYQNTYPNDISNAASLFFSAYESVVAAAPGKEVWVTETGWPTTGPTENQAIPSIANAKSFWDSVGCSGLFGKVNTWWFQLVDYPVAPAASTPAFGVIPSSLSTSPIYDLSCPATNKRSAKFRF